MNRHQSLSKNCPRSIRPLALTIAGGLLLGSAIAAGPTTQPLESRVLPPLATLPEVSPSSNVVAVPYRPYLDRVRTAREPLMLKSDGQHPIHARPAVDVPPLAQGGEALPASPTLAAGPGMQITIATSATIPVATLASANDAGRPTLATDPTLDLAPATALEASPPPRSAPPPPLPLTIPDPSRQPGAIPVPQAASEDPPVMNLDRPSAPVLTISK